MRALLTLSSLSLFLICSCGTDTLDQRDFSGSVEKDDELDEAGNAPASPEGASSDDEEQELEQETDGLPVGHADSVSAAACTHFAGTPTILTAATSEAEAAQVLIQTSANQAYQVALPENGSAYIAIEIADWMASVRFFTEHGTFYEVIGGQVGTELSLNGACPDEALTDQRWIFHGWGTYVVRIDSSESNPTWLMAIME